MSREPDDNPLAYITTAQMIDELQDRFDSMVFLAATDQTQSINNMVLGLSGPHHAVIGLMVLGYLSVTANPETGRKGSE